MIKQVPKVVNMRIRRLSSSKKICQDISKIYMEALKSISKIYMEALKSIEFRGEFTYHEPKIPNENNLYMNKENMKCSQKNRRKKIRWFHPPPFCKLVNINVRKYFLKLIHKHFNQNNILHKIFDRKTLKISYSCTKNFFEIINNHNKEIIRKYHDRTNGNNNNDDNKD